MGRRYMPQSMQIAIDMGHRGGLPEKFNGDIWMTIYWSIKIPGIFS